MNCYNQSLHRNLSLSRVTGSYFKVPCDLLLTLLRLQGLVFDSFTAMGFRYEQLFRDIDNTKCTAVCKTCVVTIQFSKSSKWNLKSHYQNLHPQRLAQLNSGSQLTLAATNGVVGVSADTANSTSSGTRGSKFIGQSQLTESLVRNLVAKCNFPLHISEDKYFRAFVYDAQPLYKPICYRTVVNTLDGLSQKSTENFILEIRKTDSRYSIGLDLWSGRDKKEYMGCIITFMKHWQLVSFLLFFSPLLDRPTAANVLQHVRNEFDRLGLRFKPFSICTDNCAVMKKAFVGLPELTDIEDANQEEPEENGFLTTSQTEIEGLSEEDSSVVSWHGCVAHLLQLVVQDGLKAGAVYIRYANTISKCKKNSWIGQVVGSIFFETIQAYHASNSGEMKFISCHVDQYFGSTRKN